MSLTPARGVVHPRWVWGALVTCVAGVVVLGLGLITLSWWVGIVGAVLLVIGALVGFRAGWMYDVHAARSAPAELDEIEEGGTHRGTVPGEMVHNRKAEDVSAALDEQRRQILLRGATVSVPKAGLGAASMLLVALLLLVAQWTVYPHTGTGQTNGLHSTYVAIVIALVGLRVLTARGEPHPVAAALGAATGVVLIVLAWLAPHSSTWVAGFESVCGVVLVLASLACLSWRET